MAHSQAAKAQTHKRILRVAAERLRQTGIDRLSIADLMKEAGLTVGGFYKHFRSRDDLVVEGARLRAGRLGKRVGRVANRA
jgi:TetR/AcrR family transcriptional regulator, transcriptional repressor for nem operon